MKAAARGNRLIALIVVVIAAVTLRPGGGGGGAACLLCGERAIADFISNILLFAPLGAGIALRRGKFWHALFAGLLLSGTIEVLQWRIIPGRDSNPGDILSNTIGTLAGWAFVRLRPWRPLRRGATARAYGVSVVTLGALLGALELLAPALSQSIYYLHWTPDRYTLPQYPGKVLHTSLGSMAWVHGPHSPMQPADSVAKLLLREPLRVRYVAATSPEGIAPIVTISDEQQNDLILIGVDGSDLVYRYRSRGDENGMDDADLRLPGVFRSVSPGDTAQLSMVFTRDRYCFTLNGATHCERGPALGDTWSVLLDPLLPDASYRVLGALFLWLAFLPSGLLMPNRRTLLATTVIVALAMVAGPLALGFASTPWYHVAAAIAGLLTGRFVGSRVTAYPPPVQAASHPSRTPRA